MIVSGLPPKSRTSRSLTKEQVNYWLRKYDKEEDLYNTDLEQELGDKLRRTKELTKDELSQIVGWKFQGRLQSRRNLILKRILVVEDAFIRKVSNESFNEQDDRIRIKKLVGRHGGIAGVGLALASVILTFYDPRNFGVYDIHVWREMFGKEPGDLFSNLENLVKFLERLREEARTMELNTRVVEKAYLEESGREQIFGGMLISVRYSFFLLLAFSTINRSPSILICNESPVANGNVVSLTRSAGT